MKKAETLYVTQRADWRAWLENNFDKKKEIWLVYPKKDTGKAKILYNDAVEEALCFGWIDSIIRTLDQDHTIQRFTLRNRKSSYSQANIERLKWLFAQDMIHPHFKKSLTVIIEQAFHFPEDIVKALEKDNQAWKHYQTFSDSYKRIRIAYIESARKRPEEFEKRLSNFIEKTRKNLLIKGFGGIDKYY